MINNFELIKKKLIFEDFGDFYYLQILQRKKDGNVVHSSSQVRLIKSYYIRSIEDFINKQQEIISLCEKFNARAYIWINPRNTTEVSWTCLELFTNILKSNNTETCYRIFDKACGITPKNKGIKWIVDLDSKDELYKTKIYEFINSCRGKNINHILYEVPTKNGVHLITEKFDIKMLKQLLVANNIGPIDIHKDNPTLLYCL